MSTEVIPPPPTYSREPEDDTVGEESHALQILINPTVDAFNFQKGFLGAEGERAAIEGELQVKDADPSQWTKVTMSLRTAETAYSREIELGQSRVILYSRSETAGGLNATPASFLFAIQLMPDTPQTIQTPYSALTHTLTADIYGPDSRNPLFTKSLDVHTRRYTSHSHSLTNSPETHTSDDPTPMKVQLPRTTFKAGEDIPVYVTVPSPNKDLIDRGLRLRNVRTELVRIIKIKVDDGDEDEDEVIFTDTGGPSEVAAESSLEKPPLPSSSKSPSSSRSSTFETILSHSGAQCRFHSSRAVQLRFVLRQGSPNASPSDLHANLPSSEYTHSDLDAECAAITQFTLLHSVTFQINTYISFVDVTNRTERVCKIAIPVSILPPPAQLPEIAPSIDRAYQKKHDRPPAKTNRFEDTEFVAPSYNEGQAGPSGHPNGAPPPFEERDAPPPFFPSALEASSSTRLPTFLESETEVLLPLESSQTHSNTSSHIIPGEGQEFGFLASQQFDGHCEDADPFAVPQMQIHLDQDGALMGDEGDHSIGSLGLVLDAREEASTEEPPPPPPPMDDPSDPPPSIDSDFRSPDLPRQSSPEGSPHLRPVYITPPETTNPSSSTTLDQDGSHPHAPPPYLGEHVTRPPPYVD